MIFHPLFLPLPPSPQFRPILEERHNGYPLTLTQKQLRCYFGSVGTTLNKEQSEYQRGDIYQPAFKSIYETPHGKISKGRPAVHPEPLSPVLLNKNLLMCKGRFFDHLYDNSKSQVNSG